MLPILNLEQIQDMLLHVPGLVRKLEEQHADYCDAVVDWMRGVEDVLTNNRLPAAASVSAVRGGVIAAARGITGTALTAGGPSKRKLRDAAATDALRRAEEIVSSALRADQMQVADGERLARQLVAHAVRTGALTADMLRAPQLEALWQRVIGDSDLGTPANHLAGLVGLQNALILFGRALPRSGT